MRLVDMVISSSVQHVDDVEEQMHVQRVAIPASRVESWTVLGDDDVPIDPIERYLAYLTDIERSPNTVKAYAHDLKDYWVFLTHRGPDWREVRLEDIGEYVAWLRLPPAGRDGAVAVLPSVEAHVGASTINRKLSALVAFYQHQARHGVDVGELLTTWQMPGDLATPHHLNHYARGHWTVENRPLDQRRHLPRRRLPTPDQQRPTSRSHLPQPGPEHLPPRRPRRHRPRPPRPTRPRRHLRRLRHLTNHDQTGHKQTTPGPWSAHQAGNGLAKPTAGVIAVAICCKSASSPRQ
jgi:hypothetical protein